MSQPWEPLDGETPAAFEAFTYYRDQQPWTRSIRNAAAMTLGIPLPISDETSTEAQRKKIAGRARTCEDYSVFNHWIERCKAWDAYKDEQRRHEMVEAIRDMSNRQATLGRAIQGAAIEALNEVRGSGRMVGRPSDRVVLQFAVEGARLERSAYGLYEPDDDVLARRSVATETTRKLLLESPEVATAAAELALAQARAKREPALATASETAPGAPETRDIARDSKQEP